VDEHLVLLCREYVTLVEAMREGQYEPEELRDLDSQRQVTHEQLLESTGLTRSTNMY